MRLSSVLVALLCIAFTLPAWADRGRDHRGGRGLDRLVTETEQVQADLRRELRALDDLVDAADSRGVQREIHRKVERIEELLIVLGDQTDALARAAREDRRDDRRDPPEVIIVETPPPVEEGPFACSEADFAGVLQAMESAPFADGKIAVLRDAAVHRWFTVAQVRRVMEEMPFSKDQVEAAALLHPKVLDQENWYRVYEQLTFESDRQELRKRVGR